MPDFSPAPGREPSAGIVPPSTDGRRRASPTIHDVAARAGVSKSLVSLVINGSSQVRESKREAVLAAIEDLGYRPSAAARSLIEGSTRAVGVMINDLRNPWYVDTVAAINARLHERGNTMLLGDARLDELTNERVLKTFLELRLAGLLLVGSMPVSATLLAASRSLPTVAVGSLDPDVDHVDVSVQDDESGARLATEHLLALGHRRLTFLGGAHGAVMRARERGYAQTMGRAGLSAAVEVLHADMSEDGGYLAGLRLLRGTRRPTAIFAAADVAALGVLRAAAQLSLRVPQDVSVVGFDDVGLAAMPGTSLTTVDARSAAVGQVGADMLLERVAGLQGPRRVHVTSAALTVRSTTTAPASDR